MATLDDALEASGADEAVTAVWESLRALAAEVPESVWQHHRNVVRTAIEKCRAETDLAIAEVARVQRELDATVAAFHKERVKAGRRQREIESLRGKKSN